MEAQHVLGQGHIGNGIGEENLQHCPTYQDNGSGELCLLYQKNIKDLILQNVAFLFCYNDDEKVFFLLIT